MEGCTDTYLRQHWQISQAHHGGKFLLEDTSLPQLYHQQCHQWMSATSINRCQPHRSTDTSQLWRRFDQRGLTTSYLVTGRFDHATVDSTTVLGRFDHRVLFSVMTFHWNDGHLAMVETKTDVLRLCLLQLGYNLISDRDPIPRAHLIESKVTGRWHVTPVNRPSVTRGWLISRPSGTVCLGEKAKVNVI